MTDNEIIEGLKTIQFNSYSTTVHWTIDGAIDLINRQQAEIERLNVNLVGMRGACNSYKMHYDNAKAAIERLHTENNQFADIGKMYSEIRAEAIKEFAERLKKKYEFYIVCDWRTLNGEIDDLVKEMLGEE